MTREAMRFLLPHERFVVPWVLGSQRKRRTTAVVALEQKYGPVGMIWADAMLANALMGVIFAVAGFVSVFAHPSSTSRLTESLMAAVALFWLLSMVRLIQAARAGRKFRREVH